MARQTETEQNDAGLLRLTGSIEHVVYANEENGFAICDLGTEAGDLITVTGTMPYIGEGDSVVVYGKWVHNPKYGRQFRVESCERQLPTDAASMLRYLASGAIKGIGPKTAQRIVEKFGDDAFDVIENHSEWLADLPGVSLRRAREIGADFAEKAGIRSAMMFFRQYFGAAATVRIYKRFGGNAVELAKRNPYLLCEEIDGIGFERADRMAQSLGVEKDSADRVAGGVCYLLSSGAQANGHVCLPRERAEQESAKLLGVSVDAVRSAVSDLLARRRIRSERFDGAEFLYDPNQYETEKYIAMKLSLLDRVCPATETANIGAVIDREQAETGVQYAALQRRAISDALESGVMLLTGGPGTGKTTVVRALLHIFSDMGMKIALAAPTGRAAKRLSESTSCEARTIHRLLEYGGEEGDGKGRFQRDESNLLEESVLIIDEASMIDNLLMGALLRAVKPGARLILIGDADQLPSVGAGNVLRDLIDSGRFATVRLTEIFRQAQKSLIVTNAHAIDRGEMPRLDVKDNDFFFLPRGDDASITATVAQLCGTRLPRTYGSMATNGTQVIVPSRKGEAGTEHLNVVLQATLNPPASDKREHRFRDFTYREGDRVMQVRNNYDLEWERDNGAVGAGVFNGDIGVIESIDETDGNLRIRFEDRTVLYPFSILEDLEPAYAVTVHKSQGCEYPIVILPLGSVPPLLRSRNLLYTAVTRAQCIVILVGREDVLRDMVANGRQTMRHTGLSHRLREME